MSSVNKMSLSVITLSLIFIITSSKVKHIKLVTKMSLSAVIISALALSFVIALVQHSSNWEVLLSFFPVNSSLKVSGNVIASSAITAVLAVVLWSMLILVKAFFIDPTLLNLFRSHSYWVMTPSVFT